MAPLLATVLALPSGLRSGDIPPTIPHLTLSVVSIAGLLFGIFYMDKLACKDQHINFPGQQCQTYTQLEWGMTDDKVLHTLSQWSVHDLVCMAISNGLHFLAAVLYGGIIVSGGLAAFRMFDLQGRTTLAAVSKAAIAGGRIFTALYIVAHSIIASILLEGPTPPKAKATSAVLILALSVLVLSVLFILFGGVLRVLAMCSRYGVQSLDAVQGIVPVHQLNKQAMNSEGRCKQTC